MMAIGLQETARYPLTPPVHQQPRSQLTLPSQFRVHTVTDKGSLHIWDLKVTRIYLFYNLDDLMARLKYFERRKRVLCTTLLCCFLHEKIFFLSTCSRVMVRFNFYVILLSLNQLNSCSSVKSLYCSLQVWKILKKWRVFSSVT